MQQVTPEALHRVLLYGSEASRRGLAEAIAADHAGLAGHLDALTDTIRSDAPWQLRARCLELLGMLAAATSEQDARQVLDAIVG